MFYFMLHSKRVSKIIEYQTPRNALNVHIYFNNEKIISNNVHIPNIYLISCVKTILKCTQNL